MCGSSTLMEGIEGELAKKKQEESQFKPGHPRFGGRGSKDSLSDISYYSQKGWNIACDL